MSVAERPMYLTPPPDHVLDAFEREDQYSPQPFPDYDEPSHWWRVFPNTKSEELQLPIGYRIDKSPRETIGIAIAHLGILELLGIGNPIIQFNFVDNPDPALARLYTLCHNIEGVHAVELWNPKHQDKLTTTIARVESYVSWVKDTDQPYFMWDLGNAKQYIWGISPYDNVEKPILVDTDPLLDVPSSDLISEFLNTLDECRRPGDRRREHLNRRHID